MEKEKRTAKFKDAPIGARFIYPGTDGVWVKLNSYPKGLHYDGRGLICSWNESAGEIQSFCCFTDEFGKITFETEIEFF